MKRMLRILLPLMLFLACVPTPEEDAVVNKTEGKLEETITQMSPVSAYRTEDVQMQAAPTGTLRSSVGAPEHCTEELENRVFGGVLQITVDADVEVPDVSAVPVFSAQIKAFSAEEKERIAKLLLGDGPYCERSQERMKKERLKASIDSLARILTEIGDRAYGEDYPYEEMRAANEAELQKCLERYAELPEPEPMEPWKGSFQDEDICLANGENYLLKIQNGQVDFHDPILSDWSAVLFHTPCGDEDDRAIETAGALFDRLAAEPFVPFGVLNNADMLGPGRKNDEQQYLIGLVRTYAGISCYAYTTDHGSDTAMQAAGVDLYSEPAFPETVEINVRGGKVISVCWNNVTEVTGTENENVALLPFSEIMRIFRKQIFRSIYLDPDSGSEQDTRHAMKITRICFSYMRVKKQNGDGTYWLLPVWDFLYAVDHSILSQSGSDRSDQATWLSQRSVLTINAIDGSIIDRNIGY